MLVWRKIVRKVMKHLKILLDTKNQYDVHKIKRQGYFVYNTWHLQLPKI